MFAFRHLFLKAFLTCTAVVLCPVAIAGELVKTRLQNGLTLVAYQDESMKRAVIDTWFRVGSVNEAPVENGLSHFLEHVMFKNAPKAISFDEAIEAYGGYTNAATSKEYTHYYYVVPSQQLDEALGHHHAMLFSPAFPPQAILDEQPVVQEEIYRAQNAPFRHLFNAMYATLYAQHRPMAQTVLGTPKDIATFDAPFVRRYFQKYYTPREAVLLIGSPLSPEQVLAKVTKQFKTEAVKGESEQGPPEPAPYQVTWPDQQRPPETIFVSTAPLPTVLWAFPEPAATAALQEKLAFEVLLYMVAGHEDSLLKKKLVQASSEEAYAVGAAWSRHRGEGFAYLYTMADPKNLPTVLKRLREAMMSGLPLEESAFHRAKKALMLNLAQQKSEASSYLSSYGEAMVLGTEDEWEASERLLRELEFEAVEAARTAMLGRLVEKQAVFLLLPEAMKPTHEALLKRLAPLRLPGKAAQENKPKLREQPTKAGLDIQDLSDRYALPVWTKALPQSALIHASWHFRTAERSPETHAALKLLEGLWMKAPVEARTKAAPKTNVRDYLKQLGVDVSFRYEADVTSVHFETLSENTAALVQAQSVLLQSMNGIGFDAAAFRVERNNAIREIEMLDTQPQALLKAHALDVLGEGLPMGVQLKEAVAAFEALDLEAVKAAWRETWFEAPPVFSMAGTQAAMDEVLQGMELSALFQAYPRKGNEVTNGAAAPLPSATLRKHVNKPDQSTTWLLWGWPLPSVRDADMPALQLIDAYLGQGMSAVLFQEVREKRGLAYEVASMLDPNYQRSLFWWYAGVKPENVTEAQAVFQSLLTQLTEAPLDEATLNAVKTKKAGRFAMSLESPATWATLMGRVAAQELGQSYITEYESRLQAVTPKQLQVVARRYLGDAPQLVLTLGKPLSSEETPKQEGASHD